MSPTDHKLIVTTAMTAFVTMAVTGAIGWFVATSDAGMDAAERDRIEEVITDHLKLDNGKSYGAAISDLDVNVRELSINYTNMNDNFVLMRQAMQQLAEDG